MTYVAKPKGNFSKSMGFAKGNTLWLLPEEALHLLERGTLDIRWPIDEDAIKVGEDANQKRDKGEEEEFEAEEEGVPMSLQGAYAAFIGMERERGGRLTLEMFQVYSALKRSGYTVIRADSWEEDRPAIDSGAMQVGLLAKLKEWWLDSSRSLSDAQLSQGPLVKPGLYRTYNDIYRLIQIVPSHDQSTPPTFALPADPDNPFRIVYHVWKPSTPFRKSDPGPPDFRIAVINARDSNVPSLSQINDLIATMPYTPPPESMKNVHARLKHGYRHAILAVVDQGVTSYLKFMDSGFAYEKMYERAPRGGSKRGGFRGGRGGGRGRGRGR